MMRLVLVVMFTPITACAGSIVPVPTTYEGCKAQFDATRQSNAGGSGDNFALDALGRGITAGMNETRYDACLATVANDGAPALPDVAGVQLRVESRTNGNRVSKTYTYGAPPAGHAAPAAAAAYTASGNRQCSLRMTGGTGYTCVGSGW